MRNRMYGGVRGKETKIGRKTFVSLPTRLCATRAAAASCDSVCLADIFLLAICFCRISIHNIKKKVVTRCVFEKKTLYLRTFGIVSNSDIGL